MATSARAGRSVAIIALAVLITLACRTHRLATSDASTYKKDTPRVAYDLLKEAWRRPPLLLSLRGDRRRCSDRRAARATGIANVLPPQLNKAGNMTMIARRRRRRTGTDETVEQARNGTIPIGRSGAPGVDRGASEHDLPRRSGKLPCSSGSWSTLAVSGVVFLAASRRPSTSSLGAFASRRSVFQDGIAGLFGDAAGPSRSFLTIMWSSPGGVRLSMDYEVFLVCTYGPPVACGRLSRRWR